MKRFWHSWMAIIVVVAMISPAAAQNDIGSYQSILARAGYPSQAIGQSSTGAYGTPAQSVPVPPSMATQPFGSGANPIVPKSTRPISSGSQPYTNSATGDFSPFSRFGPAAQDEKSDEAPPKNDETDPVADAETVNTDGGSYLDRGCDYGECPVYEPRRAGSNFVVGLGGLVFTRGYENHRRLSCDATGAQMFSTDADNNTFGGFDFSLQNRKSNGRGWEFRYWGLYPNSAVATLSGPSISTHLFGLDQLDHLGNNVYDIYGQGFEHNVVRNTSINNIELNLLRNIGQFQTMRGRQADYELLAGFRWFQFDESLSYVTDTAAGGFPSTMTYLSEVENALLGYQLGGRMEFCLTQRWRFNLASKVGIYNNFATANQSIYDQGGAFATVNAGGFTGTDYNFQDTKDDLSVLGELDFGLTFLLSCSSRIAIGYRAIGVAGVAMSTDQIPDDFTAVDQILRTNTNSSLLLGGGYFGLEFGY